MILLDSDILTLLHLGNQDLLRRLERVGAEHRIAISIDSWIEILQGRFAAVLKADDANRLLQAMSRLQRSQEWLASFEIVSIDESAAEHFEKLRTNKKLKRIGRGDLLIASIALANKATLVTRNVRHFQQAPGLQIENWAG